MPTKKQDSRIRVGDLVKVVVPRFVARVGYPKSLEDYERELAERPAYQKVLSLMFEAITGDDQIIDPRVGRKHRCRYRVERELVYLLAKRDGFGGRERTIHIVEHLELEGAECTVMDIRTANTGRHRQTAGSSGGMFGDDDYEPNGLEDMKQHRIVRLNLYAPSTSVAMFGARAALTL